MKHRFDTIEITNYRGFDYLKIDGLSKLNVFVGTNNVGKSSILETVFMLAGMSNPMIPSRINYWRMLSGSGIDSIRYLFHNMDFSAAPVLSAFSDGKWRKMTFSPVMNGKLDDKLPDSSTMSSEITQLDFRFDADYKGKYTYQSKLFLGGDGNLQQVIAPDYMEEIKCLFIPSDKNDANAISNFSILVKRGKKQIVVEAIRNFDPSIEAIEALPDGLFLKIKGINELLPVSMAGDGVRRTINILSTIVNEDYNIILVDEIDNGLHYSTHKQMWKTISEFVEKHGIQLFITTHNMECIQSLKNVMSENAVYRDFVNVYDVVKTKNNGFQAYRYSYEELKQAIENEIEIRR